MAINTWTNGNGTGLLSDTANWSLAALANTDTLTFDATSTANCRLDAAIDAAAIDMQAGYTGTIDGATDNLNHAVSGNATFAGTQVDMGSGTWTINGDFSNSALTTGSGTVIVKGSVTAQSGTFSIGLTLRPNGDQTMIAGTYGGAVTITLGTGETGKVTFGSGTFNITGQLYYSRSGGSGTLTIDAETNNPTISITGDFTTSNTGGGTLNIDCGTGTWTVTGSWDSANTTSTVLSTATFVFDGAGSETINWTGGWAGRFNSIQIDGAYTVDVSGGTTTAFTITAGSTFTCDNYVYFDQTLAIPATATITGTAALACRGGVTDMSGTLSPAGGMSIIGNSVTAAGTYDCDMTWRMANGGATSTHVFNAGTITADSAIFNANYATGGCVIDAATNNPTVNILGNVSAFDAGAGVTVSMGTGTWTCNGSIDLSNVTTLTASATPITLSGAGSGTQTIDFGGGTIGALTVNDTGATKQISAAGFVSASFSFANGTLDCQTNNPTPTVTGDFTLSGGTVNIGGGEWTVGGNWDHSGATLFTCGTSTVVFTGTGKTVAGIAGWTGRFKHVTIDTGATITWSTYNLSTAGTTLVKGTLTSATQITGTSGCDLKVEATGLITGSGVLAIGTSADVTQVDGTIDIAQFDWSADGAGDTLLPAQYDSALFTLALPGDGWIPSAGTYTFTGKFGKADWKARGPIDCSVNNPNFIFNGDVEFLNPSGTDNGIDWTAGTGAITLSGAGSGTQTIGFDGQTIGNLVVNDLGAVKQIDGGCTTAALTVTNGTVDNSVSNPSFTISGAVLIAGGATWTKGSGTITLAGAGSGTQQLDFGLNEVEAIIIDDAGAVKQLTDALDTVSLTVTAGEVDFNAQTLTTVNDMTIAAGCTFTSAGLAGCTLNVGGNFDASIVTLIAVSTWYLNVTGTAIAAAAVGVSNSDASGGTQVISINGVDSGGNTNWLFTLKTFEIEGGFNLDEGQDIVEISADPLLVSNADTVLATQKAVKTYVDTGLSLGLLKANNLSDVASAVTSRTNLGLAIGTDVEAYNAEYAQIAIALDASAADANCITFGADESARFVGDIVIRKASGAGIKVDTSDPTFGWKDLISEVRSRGIGGNNPTFAVFRGNIRQNQFGVNDEVWSEFHIPHDYVPGSDIYIHTHWAHNSASVTSGGTTWGWDVTYAKGYDQAAFPATMNPTIVQAASTTQYQHMIAEVQLSAASPSAAQLDSDDIEIDGLILVRTYLSANDMSAATDPFLLFVDIHYQSTQMATKDKNTPFYT